MNYTYSEATITLEGDEVTVPVRAYVEHHKGPGHYGYRLDGDAEACLDGEWLAVDDLSLDEWDVEHVTTAILDAAEADDSARCCA